MYLWYRGIHDGGHPESLLGSVTYTNDFNVAKHYSTHPNSRHDAPREMSGHVESAEIDLGNTFCLTDSPVLELTGVVYQLGFYDALRVLELVPEAITGTDAWTELGTDKSPGEWFQSKEAEYSSLCLQAYKLFDSKPVVELLIKRGFQSAVYGGSGSGIGSLECRPFDQRRVINYGVISSNLNQEESKMSKRNDEKNKDFKMDATNILTESERRAAINDRLGELGLPAVDIGSMSDRIAINPDNFEPADAERLLNERQDQLYVEPKPGFYAGTEVETPPPYEPDWEGASNPRPERTLSLREGPQPEIEKIPEGSSDTPKPVDVLNEITGGMRRGELNMIVGVTEPVKSKVTDEYLAGLEPLSLLGNDVTEHEAVVSKEDADRNVAERIAKKALEAPSWNEYSQQRLERRLRFNAVHGSLHKYPPRQGMRQPTGRVGFLSDLPGMINNAGSTLPTNLYLTMDNLTTSNLNKEGNAEMSKPNEMPTPKTFTEERLLRAQGVDYRRVFKSSGILNRESDDNAEWSADALTSFIYNNDHPYWDNIEGAGCAEPKLMITADGVKYKKVYPFSDDTATAQRMIEEWSVSNKQYCRGVNPKVELINPAIGFVPGLTDEGKEVIIFTHEKLFGKFVYVNELALMGPETPLRDVVEPKLVSDHTGLSIQNKNKMVGFYFTEMLEVIKLDPTVWDMLRDIELLFKHDLLSGGLCYAPTVRDLARPGVEMGKVSDVLRDNGKVQEVDWAKLSYMATNNPTYVRGYYPPISGLDHGMVYYTLPNESKTVSVDLRFHLRFLVPVGQREEAK